MIDHKCYFSYVLKTKKEMKMMDAIERKIQSTLFWHFLDYGTLKAYG